MKKYIQIYLSIKVKYNLGPLISFRRIVAQIGWIPFVDHIPYARHYKPRLVYFYPIFKDHFFVFKEVFSENYVLMRGLYSRAACNQERLMMARVRYLDVWFSLLKGSM